MLGLYHEILDKWIFTCLGDCEHVGQSNMATTDNKILEVHSEPKNICEWWFSMFNLIAINHSFGAYYNKKLKIQNCEKEELPSNK